MRILYNDEKHLYYPEKYPDKFFTSASKVLDKVTPPFDREKISKTYALKHGLNQEDVLFSWDEKGRTARERGKIFHAIREKETIESFGGKYGYESTEDSNIRIALDMKNLVNKVYAELIIPYPKGMLIGTADRVKFTPSGFHIRDYKTNEEIEFVGKAYYNKEKGYKEVKKMLSPVGHLDYTKGTIYTLQLSLYSYFLESWGYKHLSSTIDHAIFEKRNGVDHLVEIREYPVPYLKKEVESIIKLLQLKK